VIRAALIATATRNGWMNWADFYISLWLLFIIKQQNDSLSECECTVAVEYSIVISRSAEMYCKVEQLKY